MNEKIDAELQRDPNRKDSEIVEAAQVTGYPWSLVADRRKHLGLPQYGGRDAGQG